MICEKCQTPAATADTVFCTECGERLVSAPKEQGNPQGEEGTFQNVAASPDFSADDQAASSPTAGKEAWKAWRPGKKTWISAGALGVLCVAGAAIFLVVPALSETSSAPLLYLGDNELLMNVSGSKEPVQLSGNLFPGDVYEETDGEEFGIGNGYFQMVMNQVVRLNDTRDKLFFVEEVEEDGDATLYYRDLKRKASSWGDEPGVKLASGIQYADGGLFNVSSTGDIVLYIKNFDETSGGKLYLHDLKEETPVDTHVSQYWFSEAPSVLYYTKTEDGGDEDLYSVPADDLKKAVKVDSGITSVVQVDDSTGDIYYTKRDEGEELNSLTLYKKTLQGNKEKLLSGVQELVSSIEGDSFYYSVASAKTVALSELVEDDLKESDAAITEPDMSQFRTVEQVPYMDWFSGETYYEEMETIDYDAYYEASDRYYEKEQRDNLRQSLSEQSYTDEAYSLYLFSGGKGTKVADDFTYSTYADAANQFIFYQKNERNTAKKLKLSEISLASDVETAYQESVSASEKTYAAYQLTQGEEFLDEKTDLQSMVLSSDGKKLYAIETSESEAELVLYEVTEGKIGNRKVIDEDVSSFQYESGKDQLFYYKDVREESGDLYVYGEGGSKRIAIDVWVGSAAYFPEMERLLFLADYDSEDQQGALYEYKGSEPVKLAGEAAAYYLNGPGELYYLTNYDPEQGNGDLMKTGKKEPVLVSDEVYGALQTVWGYSF